MEYIALAFALVSTIAALFSEPHHNNARGKFRLTMVGWVLAVVATVSFVIAVCMAAASENEKQALKAQISHLEGIALRQEVILHRYYIPVIPLGGWDFPDKLPVGARIEFSGFDSPLILWRDQSHTIPVAASTNQPVIVILVGFAGQIDGEKFYPCSLHLEDDSVATHVSGSVFVYAPPIITENQK